MILYPVSCCINLLAVKGTANSGNELLELVKSMWSGGGMSYSALMEVASCYCLAARML